MNALTIWTYDWVPQGPRGHVRDVRSGKDASVLLSLEDARANSFKPDLSEKAPPPEQPGIHVFPDWDLADLVVGQPGEAVEEGAVLLFDEGRVQRGLGAGCPEIS